MRHGWLALVALLCVGCVTVPRSGPVERHSPPQQQVNPGVEIAPVPPPRNASPALIVEGFLHAMVTYQPGHPIARQFLTPAASDAWQPGSGVEIYAAGFPPSVSAQGVVLTAPLVGTLDGMGTFSPSDDQYHHDFGLVRDAGQQWRISKAPKGLLISQYLFASTWVRAGVCFLEPGGGWMVPDARFVPKGRAGLVAIAQAVLAGPSPRVAGAVRDGAPMQLTVGSVTLSASGVAVVELSGDAGPLSAEDRRRLSAELVWSLSGQDGVRGVQVRAGGVDWTEGADRDGVFTVASFADRAPIRPDRPAHVYALRQGAVVRVLGSGERAEYQPLAPGLARAGAIAIRDDAAQVAAITDRRTRVRVAGLREGPGRVELSGRELTGVQYSRRHELWASSGAVGGEDFLVAADGRPLAVDSAALPSGGVQAFSLAPDGARAAVIMRQQDRTVLGMATIERADRSVRLSHWRELSTAGWAQPGQPLLDVAWDSADSLLVLLTGPAGARVLRVDSDGAQVSDIGPAEVTSPTSLAAQPGGAAFLVGADGTAWRYTADFDWEAVFAQVHRVALPG